MMSNFMSGELVHLTELRQGDTELFAQEQWTDGWFRQLSMDMSRVWLPEDYKEDLKGEHWGTDEFVYVVRANDTEATVGWISLGDVQLKNRGAEVGIAIVESQQGHGYGTDALRIILKFAFDELNMHRVHLEVNGNNAGAIHIYERVGFKREGVNVGALYQDGQRIDRYSYGILQTEWRALTEATK
ncbi:MULTISPECIES: GNAT family N-acetyltransferase [Furfurilactobacillus]|uniref:GNAT family N-acetyltransferase n=1 Tax=Furfurilactobacillus rossiae TaxID=231049 RepID=A0A7C9MP49_9LACO|nr:GNAT family protein [Furfurilactobacillus milii]MYV06125.1 GNAT family N-acetyltransferase [Furfurilactobacillus milii]